MTRLVNIALVGAGEIGAVHAHAHVTTQSSKLIAIYDVHPEQARQLAGRVGSAAAPSFEAILDDPNIEGVDICVPNHLHRELVVRALEAGKHVLCEKPIALDLADADAMLAAAERANRFLMIGHIVRFIPEYRITKKVLEDGRIGEPLLMSGRRMVSLLAGTPGTDGWRRDPIRSGGAVLDMQIHDLDVFCWLLGEPESIFAQGIRSADGAWNHVFTTVDFAAGRKAFIEASFMLQGNPLDIQFHIIGTDGSVAFRYLPGAFALHGARSEEASKGPSLLLYRWGKEPEGLYTPQEDSLPFAMRDQVAHFAECIATGAPPRQGAAADSRRALALALSSQQSCETGHPINVREVASHAVKSYK